MDVKVIDITSFSATITWKTNLEANSKVRYAYDSIYKDKSDSRLTKIHTIPLEDLNCETTYAFLVSSCATPTNCKISEWDNFTTDACGE